MSQFFFQSFVGDLAQLFGPVSQVHKNTKYFSGVAPRRLNRDRGALPHVTIQCPVYKEGLHSVIAPTVRSIKAAISTYEMQGGTANIFMNDDGMQLISEEEARGMFAISAMRHTHGKWGAKKRKKHQVHSSHYREHSGASIHSHLDIQSSCSSSYEEQSSRCVLDLVFPLFSTVP